MITIHNPLCFSEIGRKDNQEDFLFPSDADASTRVFILCDGMGGHDNGEIASRTAATALGGFLTACKDVDEPTFEAGLAAAYDALDKIDTNSAKKPGTTMTCLCINPDSCLVAHIGDSRIYHIRPSLYDPKEKRGGIIYQSADHSLVNDLLKAGEITEEEARDFPQKNIITRAMQPHLSKRYKADIHEIYDIKSGDYFFLCCDGILERLSNEMLCEILADETLSNDAKLSKIKAVCDGNTRDNYSCWLVPVDKAVIETLSKDSDVIMADVEVSQPNEKVADKKIANSPKASRPAKSKKIIAGILALALAIVVIWCCAVICKSLFNDNQPAKNEQIENKIKKVIKESTEKDAPIPTEDAPTISDDCPPNEPEVKP